MEVRDLRYFRTVAEARSFSKAALKLRVAQPALSRQIRRLETTLGAPLFERHSRGVVLTGAGQLLFERTTNLFDDLARIERDVANFAGAKTSRITLGVPPATARLVVPPLLKAVQAEAPHITLKIMEGFSGVLHDWLSTGQVDIAFMHNPSLAPNLTFVPMLVEHIYLVEPPGSPPRTELTLAEALAHPLFLPSPTNSLRQLVDRLAAREKLKVEIAQEIDGLTVTKALVQAGMGRTLYAYSAVQKEVSAGELTAWPIVTPGAVWSLGAALRVDQNSGALAEFVALLAREVATLVEEGVWLGKLHRIPAMIKKKAGKRRPAARVA
ncbi:LysR family transcriptional regulator [Aquabacter sp. CN5-332]|uniref:LysR family transcriptional regulator n=1 Tax=Aquabacter sp. CN5-332 TaxID=3156608 RepID=UPI0032B4FC8E